MEKFSVYADKTTGISPFQPIQLTPTIPTYIFHALIIPIKIVTFIPVLLVTPLFNLASGSAKIIIDVILAYFFNISDTELVIDGVRRSDFEETAKRAPGNKEVILTNATGPLDWFVWKMISKNPNSVKVGIATSGGIIMINSWYKWCEWCFSGSLFVPESCKHNVIHVTDIDASSSDIDGVSDLKKYVGDDGTLFLVAEGTISNGKGILAYPMGFDVIAFAKMVRSADYALRILSTRVSPPGITETIVRTNRWWWLFLNFGSLGMNMKYRLKLSETTDVQTQMLTDTLLRERLANNGRFKLLGRNMDVNMKREYIKAVEENVAQKKSNGKSVPRAKANGNAKAKTTSKKRV